MMPQDYDLRASLTKIIEKLSRLAQADVCLTCANLSLTPPYCGLFLKVKADTGVAYKDPRLLFNPVEQARELSVPTIRDIACEGYNNELGFPEGHPRDGDWICSACGNPLTRQASVDSRTTSLPHQFRQCRACGASEFYAV